MRAAPHLWQRLRRWWALQTLQMRATQLAGLIRQIEVNMEWDAATHAALLFELRTINARLAAAQRHQQYRKSTAW